VLLLDEPAAGLDERSTDELVVLLKRLAHEWGVGILLVEHDVPLVMRACDRVVVLDQGAVIAQGTPEEMRGDQRVVDAYLGAATTERVLTAARTRPRPAETAGTANGAPTQTADTVTAGTAETANGAGAVVAVGAHTAAVGSGGGVADGLGGFADGPGGALADGPADTAVIAAIGASAGYGKLPVIEDLDLAVHAGEVVALLGANGAGKTTTLRMLAGVLPLSGGTVQIDGVSTKSPLHRRVRQGLAYVTEERSVFRSLTAGQNLRLGIGTIDSAVEVLPQLEALLGRRGGVLSGGEQQMLTLARSLGAHPRILLADELSLGLAPLIVARLFEVVRAAADDGLGVLLVEQQARAVLPFCDRAYVLRRGRVVMAVEAHEFVTRLDEIEKHYLWADGQHDPTETSLFPDTTPQTIEDNT